MTQYACILEDQYGEIPGAVVEVISVGDRWDTDDAKPTLVYKGLGENKGCEFVSTFGKYELLLGEHTPHAPGTGAESGVEYEDVTLRLPVGLKERALAEAAGGHVTNDWTFSRIVTEAVEYWIEA